MLCTLSVLAQNDSVAKVEKKHSPKTATLLALVPGAGQAYNRKYWKMPIVYAGMGACIYVVISQQTQFNRYKQAYINRDNGVADEFPALSQQALLNNMDNKRTFRDYALIGTVLIYALQIVDANVDAHLFYFDVGDDLSAQIMPKTLDNHFSRTPVLGISCKISF